MDERYPMRHMQRTNGHHLGISLIEIIIAITIIPLIVASFILVLDKTLTEARRTAIQTTLDSSSSFAIDWLEQDVRIATGFNSTVGGVYSDTYAPDGGWEYEGEGADNRVLILSLPATSLRAGTSSRILTHIDGAYNCTTELTYNPVLTYRAIYFLKDGNLYKRYLTDTTTDTCNPQIQKQSCPVAQIESWSSACKARDELLATDVSEFSIDYYNASETTPIANAYSDSSVLSTAQAVGITLTLSQTSGSNTIDSTVSLKSSRIN